MNKKKGFTLVELLGTIILMGLITALIVTPIISQINKMSGKVDKATLDLLYSTTELYMNRHNNTYKKVNGNKYYVTVSELMNAGLLEKDFLEAYSSETLSLDTQIKVEVNKNTYDYEISKSQVSNIGEIYENMNITSTYSYVGGTYIKGNYTNNYVLYNGFLWRIMGINESGTIRLIMDEYATTLIPFSLTQDYSTSYVRKWLNDYFISRIQYSGIISTEKWYYEASSTDGNTKVNMDKYVTDKVGLLSNEEYYLSLSSDTSFLKDNIYTVFLNQSDSRFVTNYNPPMIVQYDTISVPPLAVRPVINVYNSTIVTGGNGSKTTPYILGETKNTKANLTLNNANVSLGSYIKIDNSLYRIVEKENDKIKVLSYFNPSYSSSYSAQDSIFSTTAGAGYTLNVNTISNKFIASNVFVGDLYGDQANYKNTVLAKKNIVYNTYAALPALAEILTAPLYYVENKPTRYWALNVFSQSDAFLINSNGSGSILTKTSYDANDADNYKLVYTAYILSTNVIKSGSGTISDPYVI